MSATVLEMWITGSHPASTAVPSTVRVTCSLVASISLPLRGSRLKRAAAWTTASQPSSASATDTGSSRSTCTTSVGTGRRPAKVRATCSGRRTASRTPWPAELAETTGVPVATIKYYLREGLLPAADKRAARLAEYGEQHVRRLQLIKLLRDVGDIPIDGLRRLVRASERTDVAIHDVFAAAAEALAPTAPPAGPHRVAARALADRLIEAAGWTDVRPDSPDRENLAATLERIASYDTHPRDRAEIEPYVRFADQIARYEIGHLDDAKDRVGLLEEMVVGQVVFGEVLATLRRLAEEHHSMRRFGADHRD